MKNWIGILWQAVCFWQKIHGNGWVLSNFHAGLSGLFLHFMKTEFQTKYLNYSNVALSSKGILICMGSMSLFNLFSAKKYLFNEVVRFK